MIAAAMLRGELTASCPVLGSSEEIALMSTHGLRQSMARCRREKRAGSRNPAYAIAGTRRSWRQMG